MMRHAAAAGTALVILAAPAAQAADYDQRDRVYGPVVCHPTRCVQTLTTSFYQHGRPTVVLTWKHSRPAESRGTWTTPPWRSWHLAAAHQRPAGTAS